MLLYITVLMGSLYASHNLYYMQEFIISLVGRFGGWIPLIVTNFQIYWENCEVWRYQQGLIKIRNEKSKKNRQHNDRKEKQRSTKHTHKTKDRVTRTQLKTGGERMPKNSFLFLAKYWNLASTSSKYVIDTDHSFLFCEE